MSLLDAYGREIRQNKPITDEIAVSSVRDRYQSYPPHGLTPERLATILKEADQGDVYRQSELFEEMEEKDCDLAGDLQTRKLAVAGLEREILPASDSAADKKIADAAREMFDYVEKWRDGIFDMMDALAKGFSVQEIAWDLSSRMWWVKSLSWIHQKRFTLNGPPTQVGSMTINPLLNFPRLLTDKEQVWGEELQPYKFVFHRHKARSGATARGGLLRPCSYMYLFKNYDIKDWLVFNELFSVPMRLGKYKSGATPDEISKLKQAVFNLGVDAAAVVSDSTIIELLESKVRGETSAFKDLAEYCTKRTTKVILGHTAGSESTPGKLGGEDEATKVRQDLLEADAEAVTDTVKFQILAPWVFYNFGPDAGVPKFKLLYKQGEDLEKAARTIGVLVKDANFKGIPASHIHERFNIPQPKEGEETLSAVAEAMPQLPGVGDVAGASPEDETPEEVGKRLQTTQATVLNGAQVTAATAIVVAVASGQIPRDAGIGQLKILFNLSDEQAAQIMGSAGTKTPTTPNPRPGLEEQQNKITCACGREHQFHAAKDPDADWVAQYMKALGPSLQKVRASAVDQIESWLKGLDGPPPLEEFTSHIQAMLGDAFAAVNTAPIADTIAEIYAGHTLPELAGLATRFGGPDLRAMDFLAKVDNYYVSRFIQNPDAVATVKDFLTERYHAGGADIFGRTSPDSIQEFRDLFGQKLTDLSDTAVQRIVDTSVQRTRNWSSVAQMHKAGIIEIEIIEPTQDCDFCRAMHGKVIVVGRAYATMQRHMAMSPEEYEAELKDNVPTVDNVAAFVAQGLLPPFHPHCHGKAIKRVR